MMTLNTYLNFNGNCRDAMKFYEKCLGGELQLMPFSEAKMDVPANAKDRIMHARLVKGNLTLMASDTMPGMPFEPGNNFSLSLQCDTVQEAEKLFDALGEKGQIKMPMQETFWAAGFGMLTDRFGINWMFNVEKPMHR